MRQGVGSGSLTQRPGTPPSLLKLSADLFRRSEGDGRRCEARGQAATLGPAAQKMANNMQVERMVRSFQRKDLVSCLQALRLSKSGNKSQLMANLLHACGMGIAGHRLAGVGEFSSSQAVKVIQDKYAEISQQAPGVSRRGGGVKVTGNEMIRCICGNNSDHGKMIQCEAEECGIWQHIACLGLQPGKDQQGAFFCEQCRLRRADPFRELQGVVMTARLKETGSRAETANGKVEAVVGCERNFKLSAEQFRSMRGGAEFVRSHLLVSCMLIGDSTPYRIHWPLHSELRINRIPYRVCGRNAGTKLGANGRDDSFSVGRHCGEGRNLVVLNAIDGRPFLLMLSIVRKRSMQEVMQLMKPQETTEEAYARICKSIGGGDGDLGGAESDDEIETLSTVISLKCPLTGMRVKRPARFVDVPGVKVFDLDAFLGMVQRTYKWQCPHTMKNSCIQNLQVDTYLECVLHFLESSTCSEVEVSPDGFWRPAGSSEPYKDIRSVVLLPTPVLPLQNTVEAVELGDSSDEEDEEQELKRTAEELLRASASANALNGKDDNDSDVIDLISDSEEEDQPPPKRRREETSTSIRSAPPEHQQEQPASQAQHLPREVDQSFHTSLPPAPRPPAAARVNIRFGRRTPQQTPWQSAPSLSTAAPASRPGVLSHPYHGDKSAQAWQPPQRQGSQIDPQLYQQALYPGYGAGQQSGSQADSLSQAEMMFMDPVQNMPGTSQQLSPGAPVFSSDPSHVLTSMGANYGQPHRPIGISPGVCMGLGQSDGNPQAVRNKALNLSLPQLSSQDSELLQFSTVLTQDLSGALDFQELMQSHMVGPSRLGTSEPQGLPQVPNHRDYMGQWYDHGYQDATG